LPPLFRAGAYYTCRRCPRSGHPRLAPRGYATADALLLLFLLVLLLMGGGMKIASQKLPLIDHPFGGLFAGPQVAIQRPDLNLP